MPNNPYFSVIIPTYNREGHILKSLRSALSQEFADFELLVIDDGSTDNTEDVVRHVDDYRITYYKTDNRERGAARNFGCHHSKGEYINFLDSDDSLYPHHLSLAKQFIQIHANPPVFHLHFDVKDEQGRVIGGTPHLSNIKKQILRGNVLSCNGVFVRRDTMLRNLFSEIRALSSLEDWELWIRLAARYAFPFSEKVSSSLTIHKDRSVMSRNTEAIEEKVKTFIECVYRDTVNRDVFGAGLRKVSASALSYGALHLAMAGAPMADVLRYFSQAVKQYPRELMRRRALAIGRLLVRNTLVK